ncbi:hypothetical protein BKA67DRAFT_565770 [Truncatella angustata]|uniref:Uncharacterized protein n=1 Tax=Truncatella angustata TaxID=152316 RepID=A0A9P8ZZ28_9PEZI|nr:uncharacterized protein BKA67DRAFT_565770 [Truncatella angustata]KAH6654621.1 hypothetical protein BKA67DRAFT_565770 [Truncatella angustata]
MGIKKAAVLLVLCGGLSSAQIVFHRKNRDDLTILYQTGLPFSDSLFGRVLRSSHGDCCRLRWRSLPRALTPIPQYTGEANPLPYARVALAGI